MALIKIQNVVINTSYVAAVRLGEKNESGQNCVSVLMITPQSLLFPWESASQNLYHYEWIEFTSQAAIALQDYFSSCNNVIDLLPQYEESNIV